MAESQNRDDPPPKRVRFDSGMANGQLGVIGTSCRLDANEVIELRFVRNSKDIAKDGACGGHPSKLTAHPTFTHQIFPDGAIYGYRNATAAMYYTCASLHCWLDVCTVPAHGNAEDVGNDQDRLEDNVSSEKSVQLPVVSGASRLSDVHGSLLKFIHAGYVETRNAFSEVADADETYCPPFNGEPVLEYTLETKKNGTGSFRSRAFSVYKQQLASSPEVKDFHKRMQLLMFLYIDGANFIDDTDPRWELFVLFEHIGNAPRYLVGYATVYPFSAMRPGCKLDEGFSERIRISQVFIVPRYQREGHGSRLLSAIYDDALRRKAMEVTVEDPSEGFRFLRDLNDVRRGYQAGLIDFKTASNIGIGEQKVEDSIIKKLKHELLLTKTQARRCLEIHKLRFIDCLDEETYKPYRLWVKRRLYDEYLEVLDAYNGSERKSKLAEIYGDYEKEYLRVVDRLRDFKM